MSDIREGTCPKCGSNEVYCGIASNTGLQASFSSVKLYYYVCTDCGCTESYILDGDIRQNIAKTWLRVDGQKKKKNDEG